MALKNLEIWQGTWAVVTQHYHGKLIIAGNLNDAEHELLNGNLVLKKEQHEDPDYNFCLPIPLKTVFCL